MEYYCTLDGHHWLKWLSSTSQALAISLTPCNPRCTMYFLGYIPGHNYVRPGLYSMTYDVHPGFPGGDPMTKGTDLEKKNPILAVWIWHVRKPGTEPACPDGAMEWKGSRGQVEFCCNNAGLNTSVRTGINGISLITNSFIFFINSLKV